MSWKTEDFDVKEYVRVSRDKGWVNPDIVEREMLLYDTLYAISKSSPIKLFFKGGTMTNRVYLDEFMLFSWDLDFESTDRKLTQQPDEFFNEINKKLRETGGICELQIGAYRIALGEFELDKDHYVPDKLPSLLPIKRIVPALSIGAEFHKYIRKKAYEIDSKEIVRVTTNMKKDFGQILKIEEVRCEINVSEIPPSYEKTVSIKSILEPEKSPQNQIKRQLVLPIEDCLVDKIDSVSKPITKDKELDLIKDICDLAHLSKIRHESTLVERRLSNFANKMGVDSAEYYRLIIKNIEIMKERGKPIYDMNPIFEIARRKINSWLIVCDLVSKFLKTSL